MIKFILSVIIVLALIGGAIKFVATDEDWSLVINKQNVLHSVQNGAITIYDFVKALVGNTNTAVKEADLTTLDKPS